MIGVFIALKSFCSTKFTVCLYFIKRYNDYSSGVHCKMLELRVPETMTRKRDAINRNILCVCVCVCVCECSIEKCLIYVVIKPGLGRVVTLIRRLFVRVCVCMWYVCDIA